jgi:hypothetical protein
MSDRTKGPFGIDPLHFSIALFTLLILFVFYLLLPRAIRKQYFGAYPKRYAWSTRSKGGSTAGGGSTRRSGSRSYAVVSVLCAVCVCVFRTTASS